MSDNTVRCNLCGTTNQKGYQYCSNCGASLNIPTPQKNVNFTSSPKSNNSFIKKIVVFGIIIIALIGVGNYVLTGLITSPFEQALEEVKETHGVAFFEHHGTGNGLSGKEICEAMASYMTDWCQQQNMNTALGSSSIIYAYDAVGYEYSESTLSGFKMYLENALDKGILYQGEVSFNRNLKYIQFETYEYRVPVYSEPQAIIIKYYYLYFD